MTTPDWTDLISIGMLKDRESLQLVGRVLESQRVMLESQLAQTRQLQEAIQNRVQTLK
jgi:hypothetical protein